VPHVWWVALSINDDKTEILQHPIGPALYYTGNLHVLGDIICSHVSVILSGSDVVSLAVDALQSRLRSTYQTLTRFSNYRGITAIAM
jgi:hypothetical protein